MKNRNSDKDFTNDEVSGVEQGDEIAKQKESTFAHINLKAFITVLIMLLAIIALSAILTLIIPQGHYTRDEAGNIDIDSFVQGSVQGIAFWRVITAPFRVFASSDSLTVIMISIFLLVMSGVFNIIDKTGGMPSIIKFTKKRFASRKNVILCVMVLIFMAFGSFFGMFEELVTLLSIVVLMALSLGFDTLTGLGMCMMAACFGFASAITNPFSVGIASGIAGVRVIDGIYLRIILFVLIYVLLCAFLLIHTRRIAKNPRKSMTYDLDREKLLSMKSESEEMTREETRIFRIYVIFFAVQLVFLLLSASVSALSSYAIPILSVSFLVGGLICGGIIKREIKTPLLWLLKGMLSMVPAIVMIALASSVKLIMTESNIIDTVLHAVIGMLEGKHPFVNVLIIYALILFLQIFIGSASAKILLIMPIMFEICTVIGISPNLLILTYCMADGFTDVILPTNPVLLIGLSMTGVSYGKWFRFTWWFQILVFALTLAMLFAGVAIGY